jgi:hypothetical protein
LCFQGEIAWLSSFTTCVPSNIHLAAILESFAAPSVRS